MKILVAIPCLYGVDHTREAINSVINKPDVDLLLIDNGAEQGVKILIENTKSTGNLYTIHNPENIYVNPAWQQAINCFLGGTWDYLIIMNSDIIMHKEWDKVLKNWWTNNPEDILIPVMTQDKNFADFNKRTSYGLEVSEGTPGVFITLSRKQAEIINPLPSELKVWFGDNWIYEILRGCGYKTIVVGNLLSYHYWSQNVQKVAGISELIEEDKRQWEIVKHRKQAIIDKWKLKN